MKNILLVLVLLTSLMAGCDRETLNGLNIKINADVESDYDQEEKASPESETENESQVSENQSNETNEANNNENESEGTSADSNNGGNENQTVEESDPPIAFKEIKECSNADIIAKTNEKFYAKNAQQKSIDSKNEDQVKAWKKIYQEVEKSCQNTKN